MADLPKTYKAAVVEEPNSFVIRQLPLKLPGRGQVLLKVLACGICHSDSSTVSGAMAQLPKVPGHEIAGRIVAVGEGEKKWKVGDAAGGGWHGGADGSCISCQRGRPVLCENQEVNGLTFDGGYAEYVLLKSDAVVRLPDDMDPADAGPLLCHVPAGGTVAISGLGGLGHLALQYASKFGYRTVALSSSPSKKDFAMQLGAHDFIHGTPEETNEQLQKIGGADLIVCTAPNPKVIEPLVGGLARGGTLMLVAITGAALDSQECAEFSQRHGVKCMIEKFKLDDVQKAWDHTMSGKVRFRSVLVMN